MGRGLHRSMVIGELLLCVLEMRRAKAAALVYAKPVETG